MPIHDWSLVDPGIFHHLHLVWIGHLATCLNAGLLPSSYYALAEPALGDVVPDVLTLHAGSEAGDEESESRGLEREEGTAAPVSGAPAGVLVQELAPPDTYAARARRIVIRDQLRVGRRALARSPVGVPRCSAGNAGVPATPAVRTIAPRAHLHGGLPGLAASIPPDPGTRPRRSIAHRARPQPSRTDPEAAPRPVCGGTAL